MSTDSTIDWNGRLNNYRNNVAGKRLSVAGHQHNPFSLGKPSMGGGSLAPSSALMTKIVDDDDLEDFSDDDDDERSITSSFTTTATTTDTTRSSTVLSDDRSSLSHATIQQRSHHHHGDGDNDDGHGHSDYHQVDLDPPGHMVTSASDMYYPPSMAKERSSTMSALHPPTQIQPLPPDSMLQPPTQQQQGEFLEDDIQEWIELISPYNKTYRLYYNCITRETTFVRPEDYVPPEHDGLQSDESSDDSSDSDDMGASTMSSLERVQHHLKVAAHHVDRTLTHLTPTSTSVNTEDAQSIYQSIISLKNDLTKTKKLVSNASGGLVGTVSNIDSLIGWDRHRWNFTPSKAIRYYRASSSKTDHQLLMYNQWNMPQYFSVQPLLPSATKVRVQVSLPRGPGSITTQPTGSASRRTTIEVTLGEYTTVVIQKAIAKLLPNLPSDTSPQDYVLKVVGHHEYFDHPCIFFEYAYVRKLIRDFQDIETTLVLRPDMTLAQEQIDKCLDRQQQYISKIDPDVELLTKSTFTDLTDLSGLGVEELDHMTHLPISSINIPFHVEIVGVENITRDALPRLTQDITSIYIKVGLFHGCTNLPFQCETSSVEPNSTTHFRETLYGNWTSLISLLPRETRVSYVVMGRSERGKDVPLGWIIAQLIDVSGEMLRGQVDHIMWSLAAVEGKKHGKKRDTDPGYLFRAPPYDNLAMGIQKTVIRVRYPEFSRPVVSPLVPAYVEPVPPMVGNQMDKRLDKSHAEMLLKIINSDPFLTFTPEVKQLLWNCRHYLIDIPSMLPKFLQCVDWGRQDYRNEAHRLLRVWALPEKKIDAIELLDARFADYTVREYAVDILRMLTDDQLQLFCLQLVQCLKFESYHDSPLSRFLLERSLASPWVVGHSFFWHLKAEVHDPYVCERFSLILEELLSHSSLLVDELYKQLEVVRSLQAVAEKIVQMRHEYGSLEEEMQTEYKRMLNQLNRDLFSRIGRFKAPLNPRQEATTLIVDKCRYMSSKMVPLWLVFNNADEDGPPVVFIFKSGDDLRQDFLTLQLLRVMDHLWLERGLDMRLKPYNVIATGINTIGEGVGMIEAVLSSDTTSGIQLKYGGGAYGALKNDPLDLYIREHNRDAQSYMRAVDNFVRSCAGYCVATFVLGVGDRHNGNIMLTKSGHLFHIDFGHFLGNFKKKFGVNRERAAFVFTPEMAYVMGGKEYKRSPLFADFKKLCSRSFKVLRSNAVLLENLFVLMIVAQMPQLLQETDINYLRDKLLLDITTKDAVSELQSELRRALDSTSRRIDNYIHNIKHK